MSSFNGTGTMKVRDLILAYKDKKPDATPDEIAAFVKRKKPGARTTPGSVACTLNRAGIAAGPLFKTAEATGQVSDMPDHDPNESEADARKRISVRYDAMKRMANRLVEGKIPSLIVSGPPGMSKSWTLLEALAGSGRARHDGQTDVGGGGELFDVRNEETGQREHHPGYYDHIGGGCTAVGLFQSLWFMRKGGIIYLDDCDSVFRDEDALNLLKVATDSTRERLVSWRKEASWLDAYGIERTFDFKGHIAFLTNLDFEEIIRRGHKDSEHFKALIDRSLYLCLTLRSSRDFMIRIRDVAGGEDGMLAKYHELQPAQIREILGFIDENQKRFYNLSLRLVSQIALAYKTDPEGWREDIEATKMRTY